MKSIQIDSIIRGPFWQEDLRVKSFIPFNENYFKLEAIGVKTRQYYDPILSCEDLEKIQVVKEESFSFSADGERVFLCLESIRIRNAFQFDPLYAINVSKIDPLPHQIDAIYHYILKNPRIRFLLADDPGAGKTIMAGLLIKELKYRGLVERILIVVPGHLKDQWLREMKERFHENFTVVNRGTMNSEWGRNIFLERNQVIISMDFAKQEDVMFALKDSRWDLCIVDEAHKMSAYKYGEKISKTQRYHFGELISSITNYLLFLTATPHRGDPENFRLLLDLLEPGFFATTEMLAESIENKDNPLFLRRLKEDLKDFNGAPLFPPRKVETIKYYLSDDEKVLYNAVTEYVEKYFNKAIEKEKRNVAFALTILQRRLASSVRAVRKSLERRHKRLKELYEKGLLISEADYDETSIEDLEERERWKEEEELLEKLTSSETLEELKQEIDKLEELVQLAKNVEKKEIETKLNELKKVIDAEKIQDSKIKLLIFTESKDTLEYLVEKLRSWGYSVTFIHGGMNLDARIKAEADFRNETQIMVSTEAGGEGINLQFCWLMVNYDIPWNPNRLEQRMGRIHRYGQQHEVHIYNLVAVDTREGRILARLFEKLSQIKEHLGSDRVFDVIGEILVGKNLKDLILDAIANRRTMEDILKDLELIPDNEAIERVKQTTLEALATRHIDLTKILGEQRIAKENRLVPEYVEEFFKRAAKLLNIRMEKGRDGLWRITSVPFEVRNQPHSFKVKFGEIYKEYSKISFDKEQAFRSQAEFVAMGHPLLEGVIETILNHYSKDLARGATFMDPEGKKQGYIWFLESEIRDGRNEIAGKRLFAVYQNNDGKLSFINPAVIWDLKPLNENSMQISTENPDENAVKYFVIGQGLENYKKELLERRQKEAEVKRKYGIRSLESMIFESETKITEYETRKLKGENIPDVIIQNEIRKKEDLQRKKERLEKEIEADIHLHFTEPKILGVIRVVPQKLEADMVSDEEIEKIGMDVVMEFERKNGRIPEDVSSQNLGYDIRSYDEKGNYRYIEVKARAKEGAIALTPNEWLMAQRLKDEYWIYIVTDAASNPRLYLIQNPTEKIEPQPLVDIVRYLVKDWKKSASEVLNE
ncbi:DUF3883 domain-containing protein [Thermodesulfobacterium sp.]|jgi:superfamily II DNA or RNA helicase|uniref:protein NO VEIN domain-containing protein n=1 Tax=Thermodesulfobacterium sp. TaxID=1965289 RepID=UPI0024AC1A55|nr:DUF3883 domain-containing protein [Thermodesulfobacterium sp.]MBZ4681885.1 helicase [Thermodesulfobacterium sp.]MDI3477878.1 hypothetical protein [Thermoanaerobacterium sp.]MDK2793803.1 hypothetical protein [Caldanaerobacter sp.]MDK2861269.1 hypothetical protein [Thermodesulfobacterium sp.]